MTGRSVQVASGDPPRRDRLTAAADSARRVVDETRIQPTYPRIILRNPASTLRLAFFFSVRHRGPRRHRRQFPERGDLPAAARPLDPVAEMVVLSELPGANPAGRQHPDPRMADAQGTLPILRHAHRHHLSRDRMSDDPRFHHRLGRALHRKADPQRHQPFHRLAARHRISRPLRRSRGQRRHGRRVLHH